MSASATLAALDKFSTFGDLLRYLRRRTGLTQRELSIAVGYSDAQISRLEQNQRLPDLPTVAARFVPALQLQDEPAVAARLMDLAANVRREDAPASGLPPYKGLSYFDEADADLFFGREALVAELVQRFAAPGTGFLALVGASGSGKSSLVRAGLLPALRWNAATAGWHVLLLTPTAHPLDALSAALAGEGRPAAARARLSDDLAHDPAALRALVSDGARRLLVVDQFEELFTLCRREEERRAFIEAVLGASAQDTLAVVLTLRADFYAHCSPYACLREALAGGQVYLGPMDAEGLRRAIEEPARRSGWELEPGLADLLVKEVEAQPGGLPLLSHALLETWRRRRGRTLTISGYLASGGVRGAIAETAEAVLQDQLDEPGRALARRIFLSLTEPGEADAIPDTRRRVSLDELLQTEDAPAVRAVLTTLADARLVITEHDAVEVAHEALIREWPTLRGWLDECRASLRLQRHLAQAAQEWQHRGRDPGELYRGARLAQALEWRAAPDAKLNRLEQDFLEASQSLADHEAREREAQRRRELEAARQLADVERRRSEENQQTARQLRRRAWYLSGALVLTLILAGVALFLGDQARQAARTADAERRFAFSRELAAAALNNLAGDPELGLLLALEAVSVTRSVDLSVPLEAEAALHRALQAARLELVLRGHAGPLAAVAFSPDGRRVATAGQDRVVRVWDAASGAELLALTGHTARILGLTFDPQGARLASAGGDLTVIVWEAATGAPLLTLRGHTGSVTAVAFSPDGARLATASEDWTARVWDSATGGALLTLKHADRVTDVAFSPDGGTIATASSDGMLRLWEASGSTAPRALSACAGWEAAVAFSPDGARVAGACPAEGAKVWEVATGQLLYTLASPNTSVLDVAFSPDGARLATADYDWKARLWDLTTQKVTLTLAGHTGVVRSLAFSPDGARLVTVGSDGAAWLWNVALSREWLTHPLRPGSGWAFLGRDGDRFVTGLGAGAGLHIWDARASRVTLTLPDTGVVEAIGLSRDGRRLAAAGPDFRVTVWDTASGQAGALLAGHANSLNQIDFDPSGTRLATASLDYSVQVWEAETGRRLLTLLDSGPVLAVAFSPDGARLATGNSSGVASVWQAATGEKLRRLTGHTDSVTDLAFSPDGARLATASSDGTARVWDTSTGQCLLTFHGHTGSVYGVAFSPDGTRLATAGADGTARLWGAATGQELLTLSGDGAAFYRVAFSADGRRLAVNSADGLRVYVLDVDELTALALARLTRSWTADECRKHLHWDEIACARLAQLSPTASPIPASQGRVCEVTDTGGLYDRFFSQLAYDGIREAERTLGWEGLALEAYDYADFGPHLQALVDADCDLIVGVVAVMADQVFTLAQAHPERRFLLIDYWEDPPLGNVRNQVYAMDQAAFLAGYAAASATRTGKVGTFGGVKFPNVVAFMDGFARGVAHYNQRHATRVEILGWDIAAQDGLFVGNFCCAAEGRQLTAQLLDQGADIVLPVAGVFVGQGAAAEAQAHGDAYLIGVDTDWYVTQPDYDQIVLTSIEKRVDLSVLAAIRDLAAGTFTGGTRPGTLENDEVGLAPFHELDHVIPAEVKAELEQLRTEIIAGRLKTRP